ncbi:DNA repair protein RadA [Sediminitomix flava]|uniref:DNA repair protein RadA n=1 Tax=Sediminitomix flava TaxID=379075 RepID=A0A315ZHJ6_SEDFL|nr:DNA repair protein RadA [Sediminitomix flava]PWJ44673.1 DNA repair protein RadA/Sms [Sediminitomix flava]
MAKKVKKAFFCQECGTESAKWQGKCPSCGAWNSFVEEVIEDISTQKKGDWKSPAFVSDTKKVGKPVLIKDIAIEEEERVATIDDELNRVLGGGIMPGSVVLIGGEPGIGKSTLMLQIALSLPTKKVLYVSGEESAHQIKLRGERIDKEGGSCLILTETNTQQIFTQVEEEKPDLLIIDSIQTLSSSLLEAAAGSVSQVKECTAELIRYAKETNTPVFMIGHITKDGNLAGPKVLEHMVDTVLQFEGDRHMSYRILRTVKNRFGSTSEIGIYEMVNNGLRQVSNPSEILISQRDDTLSGIAIGVIIEGNRPLLAEAQSLVTPSVYGNPQRSSNGFDSKRLNMLLAVLEKRSGYKINFSDVFFNITGGLKVEDPAIDLAVCASIISSSEDYPVSSQICFAAEVGLGGEVRAVNHIEKRISEAARLGYREIYVSKYATKGLKLDQFDIRVTEIGKLNELGDLLFI